MTARHWMQIAALASVAGLAGTAIATNAAATNTGDPSDAVIYGTETPAAGAIVTPENKPPSLNDEARTTRPKDNQDDTPSAATDDASTAPGVTNPGASDPGRR